MRTNADEHALANALATAIVGIDTLWGGDVMNPSGTGRFIADSWFSDEPLPRAYRHPVAAALRHSGGVGAAKINTAAAAKYLEAVDILEAIVEVRVAAAAIGGLRGAYLDGLCDCLDVMWELVEERLERGPVVPYERCVLASTGVAPTPSEPAAKRERVAELLGRQGYKAGSRAKLLAAVDQWRLERLVPRKSIPMLADALIARLDAGAVHHLVPHLPTALRDVPRANIRFLAIEDAWFSGSMNYLGRARNRDGSPQYEATYEINAALQVSVPEFVQLVSHEVVPGHVTTFALIQARHARGELGFESTVLTMNTRGAALSEGIANNAILMAYGVTEVDALPEPDLQIGTLLALLQDDAKNQSSYLTWRRRRPVDEVRRVLRHDYLCSDERADKLSGAWGRHPLLGRMYLPAYRAGTDKVADLRRRHPPETVLPALFGVQGLVDIVTIDRVLPHRQAAAKARRTARR
ncbi:MAG TPA: hypothetical protein VFI92_01440 [Steroidobacteraceae bacterium]|nr:hypothetical protein [Steroidobacteraceae bacterium]